jgi:hypothetical protein
MSLIVWIAHIDIIVSYAERNSEGLGEVPFQ